MTTPRLRVRETSWQLAVCRFPADAPIPAWVLHAEAQFWSITRTPHELSVVCAEDDLPPSVEEYVERDWRCFELVGPVPFTTTGVISGLTTPLAAEGIDATFTFKKVVAERKLWYFNARDPEAWLKV